MHILATRNEQEAQNYTKCVEYAIIYVVLPNNEMLRDLVPLYATVFDVQERVANTMNISVDKVVAMLLNGKKVEPYVQLSTLVYEVPRTLIFVAIINMPWEKFKKPTNKPQKIKLVTYTEDNKSVKRTVEIENQSFFREWCGGYRCTKTGVEYHNAWTQTTQKKDVVARNVGKNSCLSQTPLFPLVHKGVSTDHSVTTQTLRQDLYIPTYGDRIIEPGNYVTTSEQEVTLDRKLMLKKKFRKLCQKVILAERVGTTKNRQEVVRNILMNDKVEKHWTDVMDCVYPVNNSNFREIERLVEQWHESQKRKISQEVHPTDRDYKKLMYDLYTKKLQLLRDIESLKSQQKAENVRRNEAKHLDASAKPIVKTDFKGNRLRIESESTQKAKELKEVYSNYMRKDHKKEERIEMLLYLKEFLETFQELEYTLSIIELVNREINLVSMNVKYTDGLHNRISSLLYDFFTSKKFGLKVDKASDRLYRVTYQCPSCLQLKPPSGFTRTTLKNPKYCSSCATLLDGNLRDLGLDPYIRFIENIRRDADPSNDTVPYVIKPMDLKKLVWDVWDGRSVFSSGTGLEDLRIPKWDKKAGWSPWNCILLTRTEAAVHISLEDPTTLYPQEVIGRVKQKHREGRRRFPNLARIAGVYRPTECPRNAQRATFESYKNIAAKDPFFKATSVNIKDKYL